MLSHDNLSTIPDLSQGCAASSIACSYEMSVIAYHCTWHNNPHDMNLHYHCNENVKLCIFRSLYMQILDHHQTTACTEHKQTNKQTIHPYIQWDLKSQSHCMLSKSSTCQHQAATVFEKQCTYMAVN
jgi:hypothetical protein